MRVLRGIVALCLALSLSAQAPKPTGEDGGSQAQRNQALPAPTQPSPLKPDAQVEPTELHRPCNAGQDRRNSELCAQWKAADAARDAADWAYWALVLGVIGAIGLLWTLYYTRAAVKAAQSANEDTDRALEIAEKNAEAAADQVKIAERSMVEQLRPWLKAEVSDGWLFPGSDGVSAISAMVRIKNTGKTIARHIVVTALSSADSDSAFRVANPYIANQAQKLPDLFPDEDSVEFPLTSVGPESAGFVITIRYQTVFDEKDTDPRYTEIFYRLEVSPQHVPPDHPDQKRVKFVRAVRPDIGVK